MNRTSAAAIPLHRLARVALVVAAVVSPLGCVRSMRSAHARSDASPNVNRDTRTAAAQPSNPSRADALPAPLPARSTCDGCTPSALTPTEIAVLERRIAELRERGEPCATYAQVMERSVRDGQISMRPYMWRVGAQLASGQASPDGAMIFAREIDSLNIGRRPFDEVVWTIEHEAAHIAFNLDSPLDRAPGDRADAYVKACRS